MSALSVSSFVGDAAHTSAVDVLAVGNGVIDGSASVFSSQIVGEVAHRTMLRPHDVIKLFPMAYLITEKLNHFFIIS